MDATGKKTEEMQGNSDDAGIFYKKKFSWSIFPVEKKGYNVPRKEEYVPFSLFFYAHVLKYTDTKWPKILNITAFLKKG